MPRNHHSQSGPVIVRKVADPIPPSPGLVLFRLRSKLAYLEGQIADQTTWNANNPHRANPQRLQKLSEKRLLLLQQIRGATEEATTPQGSDSDPAKR